MAGDEELLPERERARVLARDRKVRGPRLVVDNAGLKKLTLDLARRDRERAREQARARRRP